MQQMNEYQRRAIIVQYKESHPNSSKYDVAKYFRELGISESTTYSILTAYEERGNIEREVGSGRKAEIMTAAERKHLVQDAISAECTSQRKLAAKYEISHQYVGKILTEEGVQCLKKKVNVQKSLQSK